MRRSPAPRGPLPAPRAPRDLCALHMEARALAEADAAGPQEGPAEPTAGAPEPEPLAYRPDDFHMRATVGEFSAPLPPPGGTRARIQKGRVRSPLQHRLPGRALLARSLPACLRWGPRAPLHLEGFCPPTPLVLESLPSLPIVQTLFIYISPHLPAPQRPPSPAAFPLSGLLPHVPSAPRFRGPLLLGP